MPRTVDTISRVTTGSHTAIHQAGPVGKHTLQRLHCDGKETAQLQTLLQERGFFKGRCNGHFDAKTEEAVKAFQKERGLQIDGVVGQQTWGALNGQKFEPGTAMLKQPKTGHHGGSTFDVPRPGADTPSLGGVTPSSEAPSGSTADKVLETARKYLGVHEGAGNNNPFSHALGRPSEAWCADFVSYCAKSAGAHLNTASAQGVQDYLTRQGTWKGRSNPQPGDAITFNWKGNNGWADHVGMVEKVFQRGGKLYVQTIEGNSSDQVKRNVYAVDNPVIKGFGKIV
jgi:hypothetical protein